MNSRNIAPITLVLALTLSAGCTTPKVNEYCARRTTDRFYPSKVYRSPESERLDVYGTLHKGVPEYPLPEETTNTARGYVLLPPDISQIKMSPTNGTPWVREVRRILDEPAWTNSPRKFTLQTDLPPGYAEVAPFENNGAYFVTG